MSFTNGQLAQKIVDLISYWSGFNDQYHQWLTGAVNGGPNSDGRYPLTDWTGYTVNVQCPAQLEEEVLSLVNGAASSEASAVAAAAAAAQSLQDAILQVALANTARQDAELAQVAAELAQAGAEDAKVVAIAQANLAAASNTASIQSAAAALASEVAAAQSAIDAANAIGLPDAPADGQTYVRNNNAWTVVTEGSLQDAYDNTIGSTVITLRDEGGAFLAIKDSPTTAIKGLKLFELENGVGAPVAYVDNTGLITTASNGTSAQWNTAFGWGDHATAGYLTSFTETDPVFSASVAAGITVGALNNWNTAFGWGNHATQGYLTSIPASYVENNVGETISGAWTYAAKITMSASNGFQLGAMTVSEGTDSFAIDTQTRFTNASGFIGLSVVTLTGLALFDTSATEFVMGKGLQVNGSIRKYNGGSPLPVLTLTNTAYPTGGNVTISTSAPLGGVDGDFWVQYT